MNRDEFLKDHTVFPRSFLKEVAVMLSYPSLEGKKMGDGMNSFLEECFKIQSNISSDESFGPFSLYVRETA